MPIISFRFFARLLSWSSGIDTGGGVVSGCSSCFGSVGCSCCSAVVAFLSLLVAVCAMGDVVVVVGSCCCSGVAVALLAIVD